MIMKYDIDSFDIVAGGGIATRGTGMGNTYQWYSLQLWILPCTGWRGNFIYLNNEPKFIRLTKKHIK